ncbi:PorT family protein [Chitinophaga silvatica]|uniref:PorT family protein n=1 Tax=Chitinophaga silvatica TaxID=2282649 RepID=A0A3E1Y369_9BACT|nr:porin family protein [Chitinophaga silvatica]RFS19076.1 PorT family protein [Chitinophaga silvatica]
MKIKVTALIMACIMSVTQLLAQEEHSFQPHLEHRILAGFNFGAATPIGFPNTIRKINAYWPEFSPSLGYELTYQACEEWGVSLGVKMDYKGMGTKDQVQYFHTIITTEDGGRFEGDFSGHNKTIAKNAYITLPFSAVFTPNTRWRFNLGGYVAWLFSSNFHGTVSDGYIRNGGPLGEKVTISEATFDFGTNVRSFDIGVQGGAAYRVGKRISIDGNLNWGLRPIFPGDFRGLDFPLYNVFLTLGVTYKI